MSHCNEFFNTHCTHIAGFSAADGNPTVFDFLIAQNKHIGNLFELRLTDFVAGFFRSVINGYAEAFVLKFFTKFKTSVVMSFGNGKNSHLFGCKPQGECPCVFFNKQSESSLITTD